MPGAISMNPRKLKRKAIRVRMMHGVISTSPRRSLRMSLASRVRKIMLGAISMSLH